MMLRQRPHMSWMSQYTLSSLLMSARRASAMSSLSSGWWSVQSSSASTARSAQASDSGPGLTSVSSLTLKWNEPRSRSVVMVTAAPSGKARGSESKAWRYSEQV